MSKPSIYEQITDDIIESMESMESDQSWQSGISGIASDMPVNAHNNYYSGINILVLWMSTNKNNFNTSQWMTYKQAIDIGAQVRKGEKGTRIIFYKTLKKENDKGEIDRIPMVKTYSVFNLDQIDGLPENPPAPTFAWSPIEAGEKLLESSESIVVTENRIPCYIPSTDEIKLPAQPQFNTAENYYTTLAHEMAHSTAHKSRLDRRTDKNKRGFAYEELIAELSAVFTCAKLGIKGNTENHASYLKSWLKAMRNDKKYIFQAATQACKASDYILARLTTEVKQVA